MKVEVLMPKMGESITEGRILNWTKKPGDSVDKDETILEIATDKVDTEVPSPATGILVEVLAQEGDSVEVGLPVAIIETEASAAVVTSSDVKPPAQESKAPVKEHEIRRSEEPVAQFVETTSQPAPIERSYDRPLSENGGKRFYSPVVMRIASEQDVSMSELERVKGSGAGGRVTKKDLLEYLESRASAPAPGITGSRATETAEVPSRASSYTPSTASGNVEIIPLNNMRRLMAEHMVKSKQISPHVALNSEIDLTKIVRFRDVNADAFKKREGFSLTFMPFIADAVLRALKEHPFVNASLEGTNVLLKHYFNLGIAVALEDGGLIVPVIKNADTLNLVGLARAVTDVAFRARTKKLLPDEIQDGTFTITNFGVFGNAFGIPIINQPQVAILGVGALQKKPVVIEQDGQDVIAIRSMINLTLSFDHRIIDGALGGRFLGSIQRHLESFDMQSI